MSDRIPWSELSDERKQAARTEYKNESGVTAIPADWDVRDQVDDPGGAFAPRDTQSDVSREAIVAAVIVLLVLAGGGLDGN